MNLRSLRASLAALVVCALVVSSRAADFNEQHKQAVAGNPAGVHFKISLRDGQQRFRVGDRITLDYAFTSESATKYLAGGNAMDPSGRSILERFVVDRPQDVADPLAGFFDLYNALYCSPEAQSSVDPAKPLQASTPVEDSVSVTEYLRFTKPGHYRLYAVTQQVMPSDATRVGRRKGYRPSVDDTSLFQWSTRWNAPSLASENVVEFEILPQDKALAAEEVDAIVTRTKARSEPTLGPPDALRLFEIGTPQARQAAVRLYASNLENYPMQTFNYAAVATVLGAPTHAEAIQLMRQRLLDPSIPPDHELFFDLPVLQLLEKNPELTGDSIRNGGRVNGDHWRAALVAGIQAQYQELMGGLKQRSAPGRALTARFLHMNMSDIYKACSVSFAAPAEDIAKLQAMRLETQTDLPAHEQQMDLLTFEHWTRDLPAEQTAPLLAKIFDKLPDNADLARIGILRGIARSDPQTAGKLFRRRVIEHNWAPELSNFIQESWLEPFGGPDLDDYFAKMYAQVHTEDMERAAPLLARFGTAGLLSRIKPIYEVQGANWPCRLQAGMLTYFVRVEPAYGVAQTTAALEESYKRPSGECRESSLLVAMALLREAPELESLANTALDDPRPLVAWGGARVLGIVRGRNLPYMRLLERLQKLHDQWLDYGSRTNDLVYMARWQSGYGQLEEIIVRLLTNTTSQQLLPVQRAALQVCVTETCRLRVSARLRDAPIVTTRPN